MLKKLTTGGFVALGSLAVLMTAAPVSEATVVYCVYINMPVDCVVRPGVVLRPAPAVRARTPGVNTTRNLGGPVNRVGRR